MHGELNSALCTRCGAARPWSGPLLGNPACPACQQPGSLRPDIVWFGEMPFYLERIAEALAERLSVDDTHAPHERLSDREFQTLIRLASGKRLSDIAAELSLSPKTVTVYRTRVMEKLAVQNNAELTAYCLRNGLID
jgi:DNA-binding CsgD family transcriptional regulator